MIGRDQVEKVNEKTDIDIIIGRNIRARRKILGITQGVLGERIGVSFQQIQKYEKGVNSININKIVQISYALQVPVTYLVAGIQADDIYGGNEDSYLDLDFKDDSDKKLIFNDHDSVESNDGYFGTDIHDSDDDSDDDVEDGLETRADGDGGNGAEIIGDTIESPTSRELVALVGYFNRIKDVEVRRKLISLIKSMVDS